MVKCLNIGTNIGKPIYRSISSYVPTNELKVVSVVILLLTYISLSLDLITAENEACVLFSALVSLVP